MSCYPLEVIPIGPPQDGAPPLPTPGGPTKLIDDPGAKLPLTGNRECDAITAAKRGLAEYLAGQEIMVAGRLLKLRTSLWYWADTEDDPVYPSAWVASPQAAPYGAQAMTPDVVEVLPDGRFVGVASDLTMQLIVEVWNTDDVERTAMGALVEDALQPVDWMYGARLWLPHYHGVTARYGLMSAQYVDDELAAMRRYRVARFVVSAEIPVVRVLGVPRAKLVRAVVATE